MSRRERQQRQQCQGQQQQPPGMREIERERSCLVPLLDPAQLGAQRAHGNRRCRAAPVSKKRALDCAKNASIAERCGSKRGARSNIAGRVSAYHPPRCSVERAMKRDPRLRRLLVDIPNLAQCLCERLTGRCPPVSPSPPSGPQQDQCERTADPQRHPATHRSEVDRGRLAIRTKSAEPGPTERLLRRECRNADLPLRNSEVRLAVLHRELPRRQRDQLNRLRRVHDLVVNGEPLAPLRIRSMRADGAPPSSRGVRRRAFGPT